jgi:hypothetical protein
MRRKVGVRPDPGIGAGGSDAVQLALQHRDE